MTEEQYNFECGCEGQALAELEKENTTGQGESMDRMLKSVLNIYREIEELQENINSIYEKAKIRINGKYECEEDKEFDKDYFECIKSYVRN